MTQVIETDVLIVGGGITGLTLALALRQSTDLTITIVDVKAQATTQSDDRVSAITLAFKQIFKHLSVWPLLHKQASPFTQIEVWDNTDQVVSFSAEAIAESALGYICHNAAIEAALYACVTQHAAIQILHETQLTTIEEQKTQLIFHSTTDVMFKTTLAVAADGAQSWLREKAKLTVTKKDYHQTGIVATVTLTHQHHQTAKQQFLSTGPLAFLPLLADNVASIVWSVPSEEAGQLLALPPEAFVERLNNVAALRLGSVSAVGKRQLFPLRKHVVDQYVAHRIALIGEAAHVVHPLAGQGVNMGLLDAASLADVISAAYRQGQDFASDEVLRRYNRWRKADNWPWIQGIEWMQACFASNHMTIQATRALGMRTVDRLAFVKKYLMYYAVGRRSGLPLLAQ